MLLFYDTETSGLPDFRAPSEAPHQPHIIQLAAIVLDEYSNEVRTMNRLIKTDGLILDKKISELTGITQEQLDAEGLEPEKVMAEFSAMAEGVETYIGHNESFDARMVRIMYKKLGLDELAEAWEDRQTFCTMNAAAPIVNLPPTPRMLAASFNKPKAPKLEEAYRFFHDGQNFDGAHDALNDVRATISVYYELMKLEEQKNAH